MAEARRHVELRYDPKEIDRKWQDRWDKDGLHRVDNDDPRPKWYEMTMYPYPSGDLHIGHWYAMAPADCHARFRRMQGYNVLHPIGFDAFGLPAENAAISRGVHPYSWTMSNIENMRKQLRSIGAIYDWDREIVCCLPEYYRWNQWLFLKFFHQGLAYRAKAPVVWCPSCQTVLANEQVINGNCERCGTTITRRDLEQWFFRITQYADRLLDFSGLLDWPNKILTMQTNWIGRSEGVEISFDISDNGLEQKDISTFTTRIDTIFGVTFIVLAPEHSLVADLTTEEHREAVEAYIDQARRTSEIDRLSTETDKTGVFTGSYAINRLNGEKVPIYIGDYVLMTYGTGAVMGVPAHDSRDFVFAQKYRLPVRIVVAPISWDGSELTEAYLGDGFMTNSGAYDGMTDEEGIEAISADIEKKGWGSRTVSYRMRDWLVSRQRYWGTPIPVVYCDKCGIVPVPEEELPVLLPTDAEYIPTGEGSPLASNAGFLNTTCYRCGGPARRETDTMDTFFDSSWYMLRYTSPGYSEGPFDPAVKDWLPVDQYTGGAEHAVMHLLYSRFFIKGLHDMGVVDFEEPFLRLFNQGVILGEDHEKMSKSRGNVVNPDEVVEGLGADAVRCFMMFIGPWDQGGPWSEVGINGVARWLNRVWDIVVRDPADLDGERQEVPRPIAINDDKKRETLRVLHQTIRRCHNDLDRFKFNTAIASLMELANHLNRVWAESSIDSATWRECIENFLLMLAPIAPHVTEELWERTGHAYSIHQQAFPSWDDDLAAEDTITLVVQVNGKVRDKLEVPAGIEEAAAQELALASPRVKSYTDGKSVSKTIFVPGRLVNLVVQ
jgi:leucyl-tRNA synthetase